MIIISYKLPVKIQVFKLFLALEFIGCALIAKTLEFSDFMQASPSRIHLLQKTLVFDSNQNKFRLVFCHEIPYSYQQCLDYNYYLFSNFHIDSGIRRNSSFSHQLIKTWLFHKSSIYWLNLIFSEDLEYLSKGFYGVKKQDLVPLFESKMFLGFPKSFNTKFRSSDDGLFSNDFTPLVFQLDEELGFSGQGNRVYFPYKKRQDHFLFSRQKIDFIAILNHELGHTRYGLKDSDSLIGEALVVKKIENPVRIYDGYEKRKYYYSKKLMKYIDVESLEEFYISNSNSL